VGSLLVFSEDGYQATITGSQSSGRIASLSHANSLLFIPPESICQPGDEVEALLLDGNAGSETEYQWVQTGG
jgi:molybdopterin biosynthesis enzyme